jgi:hypothetical protein
MIIGDKYICNNNINNVFGQPLYIKDNIYTILDINNEYVTLDHIFYGNEYAENSIDFLKDNFTSIENISSDRNIFICSCHSLEHQYSFWYSKEDGLYCEPHLDTTLPFYKRLILGIKYIFGYKSRYGSWDEFLFKKEDLNKLKNIINNI